MSPILTALFVLGLIVWGGAYVIGLQNRVIKTNGMRRIPLWTKLVMISIVLLVALLGPKTLFGLLLLLGLFIGALGDLTLAGVLPFEKPAIPGMVIFAAGHAFYVAAPLVAVDWPPLTLWVTVAAGALIAVIGWRVLAYNPQGSQGLNTGSLVYGIVLIVTAALAVVAAFLQPTAQIITFGVGVVVFAASDMLLAQYMIKGSGPPNLRDLVWIVYSSGQILIAVSIWL